MKWTYIHCSEEDGKKRKRNLQIHYRCHVHTSNSGSGYTMVRWMRRYHCPPFNATCSDQSAWSIVEIITCFRGMARNIPIFDRLCGANGSSSGIRRIRVGRHHRWIGSNVLFGTGPAVSALRYALTAKTQMRHHDGTNGPGHCSSCFGLLRASEIRFIEFL